MAFILLYQLLGNEIMAVIENSTTAVNDEWEYYYDYLDPVIVDESKLKYNKCKSALKSFCVFVLQENNSDCPLPLQT